MEDFSKRHPTLINYLCGCTAACIAEAFSFPFDIIKTRKQIAGEHSSSNRRSTSNNKNKTSSNAAAAARRQGMLKIGFGIVRNEGVFSLYRGLSAAFCRHLVYSGLRISIYKEIKKRIFVPNPDGTFPLWMTCMTGFFGGGIAQAIASPFDLLRVQMQMDGLRKLEGKEPRCRNVIHGLTSIYKKGGIPALWKGWVPTAQKSALVNLADLGVYDSSKQFFLKEFGPNHMFAVQCAASSLAGLAAAIIGTPADTIKARVMNQPTDERGRGLSYKGSIDCIVQTVKNEGPLAIYKGFFSYWSKLVPFTLIFWNVHEFNLKLAGLEGF